MAVDIAERHGKPLIFVVNAANARARITGESAVALSQHGTVAPVIVHHRMDFAASTVGGRTVGEVVPDSPSARENSGFWAYIQAKLSRIVRDTTLISDVRPAGFVVRPPTAAGAKENLATEDIIPSLPGIAPERRAELGQRAYIASGTITSVPCFRPTAERPVAQRGMHETGKIRFRHRGASGAQG